MKTIKIVKNQIDSKSIYFHFSTDSRHLNLRESLELHFTTVPFPISEKKSLTNSQMPDIQTVQLTKSFLMNVDRLSDDFDFRQEFQSWEQPET